MPMRPFLALSSRASWTRPSARVSVRLCASAISSCLPKRCITSQASTERLDLLEIDKKWQHTWQTEKRRLSSHEDARTYILAMFPYPSGSLHMGHLRVYTITDVLARYWHMKGHSVLYPMGWDAFGLPAENAAIERGIDPAQWTSQNINKMKEQLKSMNTAFDWDREFKTSDPEFYKHTQQLFLHLYSAGLAYQAEALVNYDPIDRTVLANEQVDANGYSWRSGAKVERINLKQWFLKITDYKDALLDDIKFLGEGGKWPERVLAMQKHWLGKSEGAKVRFKILDDLSNNTDLVVDVFTTRPDTIFGAQYVALSTSHPLVKSRMEQDPGLKAFVDSIPLLPADSKNGYQITSIMSQNPLSAIPGSGQNVAHPLPVFVAPYVLDCYGSGAVMGVPGHDTRDHAFWKQNRPSEPVVQVVKSICDDELATEDIITTLGVLNGRCGNYEGLSSQEASRRIVTDLTKHGQVASKTETWRLRDWLISRQRYWGTPIPIIHCRNCGSVPVPDKDLPVVLPKIENSWMKHHHGNPLESADGWVNVACPGCGTPAKRDTDTMDTFACSSWYMFRFADPHNNDELFSPVEANRTLPVSVYVGGIEHAILHLLYARFIGKFLASANLWPDGSKPEIKGEPFQKLLSQGMVHGKTFSDPHTGRFLKPEEVDLSDPAKPKVRYSGDTAVISFEKMSKSKYNGVDPSSVIAKYGADVTRVHMLFQSPVSEVLEWEEDRIIGVQRWFQKIWRLVHDIYKPIKEPTYSNGRLLDLDMDFEIDHDNLAIHSEEEKALLLKLYQAVNSTNEALSRTYSLNTCISTFMELTNSLSASSTRPVSVEIQYYVLGKLLKLLCPFAPAFTSECWEVLHRDVSESKEHISMEKFPDPVDLEPFNPQVTNCAIMENGKLRFAVEIKMPSPDLRGKDLEDFVLRQVEATDRASRWLASKGKKWKRIVVVKGGKTVNFVG